jgi:hypothetical protein
VLNALIVLRFPLHPIIHRLTRQRALHVGATLHLLAFGIIVLGDTSMDGAVVFLFGLVPAALLFLAAFAMERRVQSAPSPVRHPPQGRTAFHPGAHALPVRANSRENLRKPDRTHRGTRHVLSPVRYAAASA